MMETMESSSFYHDTERKMVPKTLVKTLKSNMSLDFNQMPKKSHLKHKKLGLNDGVLNSPDINMLKLASPELERLIIQQGVMTTPTPTTQILFPKSVTEEQEAYARGFVDALAELHDKIEGGPDEIELPQATTYTTLTTVSSAANKHNGQLVTTISQAPNTVNGLSTAISAAGRPNNGYAYSTVTELPGSVLPSSSTTTVPSTNNLGSMVRNQDIIVQNQPLVVPRNSSPMQFTTSSSQHNQLMQVKEEDPQRVPSLSPQLTPINMVHQEVFKLERKRARNRIAARKCRTRKLERISRLEDRVDDLKGHNGNLVQNAKELREQVFALKQQILEHVNSGCKVMLSANML